MNDKANRYNSVADAMLWIWQFYRDGFMSMTVGRQLWGLIIFKILVLLLVFRIPSFSPTYCSGIMTLTTNAPEP